jgi:hypothetical protein
LSVYPARMRSTILISLCVAVALAVAPARAQEHPEHPSDAPKAKAFSVDDLEKSIKEAIAEKEKKDGGVFKLADKQTGKTWNLKLDKVHRERLARTNPHTFFACTDFKSSDGHLVDVDFFMKEKGDKLAMEDVTVHKVDGKPRYNWQEKDGYWVRVPVK